jgi:peptide/nickel transport system substrate-binding protein
MSSELGASRITRRQMVRTAALAVMTGAGSVLLQSCSSAPAASGAPTATKPAATTAPATTAQAATSGTPKLGGTLHYAEGGDFSSWNPWDYSGVNQSMYNLVFNRLVSLDADGKPRGELAESWQLAPDAMSLSLKLRPNVKWHDGKDFTADDVVNTFPIIKDPEMVKSTLGVSKMNGLAAGVGDVKATDKYTVQMTFPKPQPAITEVLDYWYILRMDDKSDPNFLKTLPVGTGPFKATEWAPGQRATFQKNASYWNQGFPRLDTFDFQRISSHPAVVQNLKAKALDTAPLAQPDYASFKADSNFQVFLVEGPGGIVDLNVNVKKPPFDNIKVRQALSYAINRAEIVKTAYFGIGQPTSTPFYSPTSIAFSQDQLNYYAFDLDKAKSLLAEAGVNNLAFPATSNVSNPQDKVMLQIVQADLAKIGVQMNVSEVESAQLLDSNANATFTVNAWGNGRCKRDPATFMNTQANFTGRSSPYAPPFPELDKLIDAGASEIDPDKRKQIYQQANAILVQQTLYSIPVCTSPSLSAAFNYVKEWQWCLAGPIVLDSTWLDK